MPGLSSHELLGAFKIEDTNCTSNRYQQKSRVDDVSCAFPPEREVEHEENEETVECINAVYDKVHVTLRFSDGNGLPD